MKHFDPTINLFSPAMPGEVARFSCQREHVQCFHCGQTTVIPVRPEFTDYRKVYERYYGLLQGLVDQHNAAMAEIDLIYGPDNPAAVYYRNKLAALVLEIRHSLGDYRPGTSAGIIGGE